MVSPKETIELIGAKAMRTAALAVLFLCACDTPEDKQLRAHRAAVRIELFRECMAAAAKIERKADDDVSDIVSECSTQAAYMARDSRQEQK